MKPLVSIIVPVHNKGGYLRQCIESLRAQSLQKIEIIVIDDCSTDNSLNIAHELAKSDSRIRVFSNSRRMGLYRNRQHGALEARASLLQFVDADDWLESDATQQLFNAMNDYSADLVQMHIQRVVGSVKTHYGRSVNPSLVGKRLEGNDFRSLASFIGMDSYITPSCCDKMYWTELMRDSFQIDFTDFWGEDQIVNIQYMRNARSIAFIDYVGYNYRWGGESTKYKYNMLISFKNVWYLKKLLGLEREYIDEELQDLLRYNIRQLSTELGWTRNAIVYYISKEMKDPVWKEIGIDTDADVLVDEELQHIKRRPFKYLAKRLMR